MPRIEYHFSCPTNNPPNFGAFKQRLERDLNCTVKQQGKFFFFTSSAKSRIDTVNYVHRQANAVMGVEAKFESSWDQ